MEVQGLANINVSLFFSDILLPAVYQSRLIVKERALYQLQCQLVLFKSVEAYIINLWQNMYFDLFVSAMMLLKTASLNYD